MGRFTLTLPKRVEEAMNKMAEEEGISRAEIFRRALALYGYIHKETRDSKNEVAITDEDGRVKKVLVTDPCME